eukprot:TRINITY_DN1894_c0_g1_i5.p1 TRINITY_DN1894_c0_g1~~TRINITY_DN1894_c0_g1_i5.p1  ORF type:complete len:349 (-),score=91.24 TRINITY_DN1894_c0_g1_i5:47-1000(-)
MNSPSPLRDQASSPTQSDRSDETKEENTMNDSFTTQTKETSPVPTTSTTSTTTQPPPAAVPISESEGKICFPLQYNQPLFDWNLFLPSVDNLLSHRDFIPQPLADENRQQKAGWCEEKLVEGLWLQKSRMDNVFDKGRGDVYYRVRDRLCPFDKRGSSNFSNRAGDKLHEISACVNFLMKREAKGSEQQHVENFIDVCGAPGAWSQLLLRTKPSIRGYGLSIILPDTPASETWYHYLQQNDRFMILFGSDGTGNIYVPENIVDVAEVIEEEERRVERGEGEGGGRGREGNQRRNERDRGRDSERDRDRGRDLSLIHI